MPEGHTIHRLAREHNKLFGRRAVQAVSPQGKFTAGAGLIDGLTLELAEAHGKHLFHRYEPDLFLHVHLGLFGKWRHGEGQAPAPVGQVRLVLQSEDTWGQLRGPTTCQVLDRLGRALILARLGPDPLRADADPELAWLRLSRSRVSIAALLMAQDVVSGIGNVYRAELLFRHRVPPLLPGRELDHGVWQEMWSDLSTLMRAGVRSGRIVTTEPADRFRRSGRASREDSHYVYRRHDLPCRICGTPVARAELAARNLYWCPVCQAD